MPLKTLSDAFTLTERSSGPTTAWGMTMTHSNKQHKASESHFGAAASCAAAYPEGETFATSGSVCQCEAPEPDVWWGVDGIDALISPPPYQHTHRAAAND